MTQHRGLAVAALLALAGCGEKSQTITGPDGSKTTVTQSGDSEVATITTKSADGTATMATGTGATWPVTAPDYAAPYPGASIQMAMTGSDAESAGSFLNFTTSDAPEKVIDFYKSRAKAAGLGNETNMDVQGARMYGATAEDGRNLSVQTGSENGVTTVVLSYSSKAG